MQPHAPTADPSDAAASTSHPTWLAPEPPSGPAAAPPRPPQGDPREIRGWAMYDWANSAFSTTVVAVFIGPYVAGLARAAAHAAGSDTVSFLGIPVAPDSFMPYCISASVLLQVLFLPVLGAIADYSHLRKQMLRLFATLGALATLAMFFVEGSLWWLGGLLFILANLAFGAALVFYNAYLPDLAGPEQQDRVSSFGWAMGYLGGGLLLLFNLLFFQFRDRLGIPDGLAVRLNLASAGLWWLGWSAWTWRTLRPRGAARQLPPGANYLSVGLGQLRHTFSQARRFPHTLRFLLAYLIYNDGIQTMIAVAAIFATAPLVQGGLEMAQGGLIQVILMIQFVAFFGALFWGRLAGWIGAKRALLVSLAIWTAVVVYAYGGLKGDGRITEFWLLGACIAVVMGGSQAISRSLFARMIPPGQEAEFFAVYEISERGTSWVGPLLFGLVNQWLGNLRPAILALIVFFVVGSLILAFAVDVPRAIAESHREDEGS